MESKRNLAPATHLFFGSYLSHSRFLALILTTLLAPLHLSARCMTRTEGFRYHCQLLDTAPKGAFHREHLACQKELGPQGRAFTTLTSGPCGDKTEASRWKAEYDKKIATLRTKLGSDSCTDLDLNQAPNSPLLRLPILDQDGTGTCYAHAAQILIDYERFKKDPILTQSLDPLFLAWLTYFRGVTFTTRDWVLSGGYESDVIAAVQQQGICTQDPLRKNLDPLAQKHQLDRHQLVHFLESLYENSAACEGWNLDPITKNSANLACCKDLKKLRKDVKNLGFLGLSVPVLFNAFYQDCKLQKVELPEYTHRYIGTDVEAAQTIQTALENEHPPSISVCMGFETATSSKKRFFSGSLVPRILSSQLPSCHNHSVAITGKRRDPITGKCQYLLRHSYGPLWGDSNNTLQCAGIDKEGQYHPDIPKSEIGKGYVGCWYDRKVILGNTYGVGSFKTKARE